MDDCQLMIMVRYRIMKSDNITPSWSNGSMTNNACVREAAFMKTPDGPKPGLSVVKSKLPQVPHHSLCLLLWLLLPEWRSQRTHRNPTWKSQYFDPFECENPRSHCAASLGGVVVDGSSETAVGLFDVAVSVDDGVAKATHREYIHTCIQTGIYWLMAKPQAYIPASR